MTTIAVAVVLHRGRVLVGRRAVDAVDAAGLAEFPGGKVEPGEAAADAAARECLEESGIRVWTCGLLDRGFGTAADGPLELVFFAALPIDDGRPPLAPFAWVPVGELAALRFPSANARVLARLAQGGS